MDFSLNTYQSLIKCFIKTGYNFQAFQKHLKNPNRKTIIFRHDVDKLPQNSLQFAQIQHKFGIKASYYFRIVPESFNEKIIKKIADLGHEIGYHYEDMDLVWKTIDHRPWTIPVRRSDSVGGDKMRKSSIQEDTQSPNLNSKNIEKVRPSPKDRGKLSMVHGSSSLPHGPSPLHQQAIKLFKKNLTKLRQIAPVKTICMHGSPRSPFDNKELWKYYNYRDYGIIGEPYFDIDFTKVAYYTDTGRMWDGDKYSVRDRIDHGQWTMDGKPWEQAKPAHQPPFPRFHSTQQIITALQTNTFPNQAMLTFHPQRWTNNPVLWTKELVLQSAKNVVKRYFFVK